MVKEYPAQAGNVDESPSGAAGKHHPHARSNPPTAHLSQKIRHARLLLKNVELGNVDPTPCVPSPAVPGTCLTPRSAGPKSDVTSTLERRSSTSKITCTRWNTYAMPNRQTRGPDSPVYSNQHRRSDDRSPSCHPYVPHHPSPPKSPPNRAVRPSRRPSSQPRAARLRPCLTYRTSCPLRRTSQHQHQHQYRDRRRVHPLDL